VAVVGKRKMTVTKKQITWTLIATLLFYVAGRLVYEPFYRWTPSLIKIFSGDTVHFFGKFPFWFFGAPKFGLVCSSIPLTMLLCYLLLKNKYKNAFRWTLAFYLPILVICYLLNCYTESIALVSLNDFYKSGETLQYSLRQVDINNLIFISVIVTTILTTIINAIKRFRLRKRQPTTTKASLGAQHQPR
jgi:hypothetical protein